MRTLAAWVFILGVAVWLLRWIYHAGLVPQPVPFPHKRHSAFGIACEACHVGAREAEHASIPNIRTCALCHVPGLPTPPTPPRLARYLQEMKDIPWRRIYQTPAHVRFSHARHVGLAGTDCKACHGDVAAMDQAVLRQAVPLEMGHCLDCHRREKITTDCLACHR